MVPCRRAGGGGGTPASFNMLELPLDDKICSVALIEGLLGDGEGGAKGGATESCSGEGSLAPPTARSGSVAASSRAAILYIDRILT